MARRHRDRSRRSLPLAAALPVVLGFLSASPAAAQTITLGSVTRANPRPSTEDPNSINLTDCQNDEPITFPLSLSNFADHQIEFWVSNTANCADRSVRLEQQDPARCTEIRTAVTPEEDTPQYTFTAPEILAGELGDGACEDFDGSASKTPLRFHFLLIDDPDEDTSPSAVWESDFDLLGPSPPTDLRGGGGEERVIVEFTPSSATGVNGYKAFCGPALGADEDNCEAEGLTPGEIPDPELECSDIVTGGTSNEAVADDLANGTRYAVGVAAVDDLGNVGPLSANVVCATPQPSDGFYELYRASGGQGGGGLCAFRAPAKSAVSAWLMLLAVSVLVCRKRRTRSTSSSARPGA